MTKLFNSSLPMKVPFTSDVKSVRMGGLCPPSECTTSVTAVTPPSESPDSSQRVSLAGCGLERVQIGEVLASKAIELDLSGNPIREIDALAGPCLRGIEASGCRLTRVPRVCRVYRSIQCMIFVRLFGRGSVKGVPPRASSKE